MEKVVGKYSPCALVAEIRREEDKQMALAKKFPAGDARDTWHRAVSTGLCMAADIVEEFFERQSLERTARQ